MPQLMYRVHAAYVQRRRSLVEPLDAMGEPARAALLDAIRAHDVLAETFLLEGVPAFQQAMLEFSERRRVEALRKVETPPIVSASAIVAIGVQLIRFFERSDSEAFHRAVSVLRDTIASKDPVGDVAALARDAIEAGSPAADVATADAAAKRWRKLGSEVRQLAVMVELWVDGARRLAAAESLENWPSREQAEAAWMRVKGREPREGVREAGEPSVTIGNVLRASSRYLHLEQTRAGPFVGLVKRPESFTYRVWFGTNRKPLDASGPQQGFGNQRDERGTIRYGRCAVAIPRTHRFGSVGTAWWRRWVRLRFADDHLKIIERAVSETPEAFLASLRAEMGGLAERDQELLVYIHGYNVTFDEAALRAAQIGFDLKVSGATAFFSWPSSASLDGYFVDQQRIAASEADIATFLVGLAKDSGAKNIHVLAHSMGSLGFVRALHRIAASSASSGVRFGQIILAAPDIDVTLFRDLAKVYPLVSQRTTMYVSAKDLALETSRFLQDSDRAGFTPPVTVVPGIDTVEVSNIDLTILGHVYFAKAEAVLYDMDELVRHGEPPSKRLRLREASAGGSKYWILAS